MIAVIADDFTGAAEIGGIGLRHGLDVVIDTGPIENHNTDLIIVATDTRSLPPDKASEQIAGITDSLLRLNPKFLFKKLDSVLRGNVKEELLAQMKVSGKKRALVIAANPVFKRIIRDGNYYIDDIPLNKTFFASDPQYPVRSSSVLEILGTDKRTDIHNLKSEDEFPDTGLIIGDVTGLDDLKKWAARVDENTMVAGASGFFNTLLEKQKIFGSKKKQILPFGEKSLYVLGSTYPKDIELLKKIKAGGHYLSNMPEEIYYNKDFNTYYLDLWVHDIVKGINMHSKVIALIMHSRSNEPGISMRIKENIGELIKRIVDKVELNELLIEGGSTTSVVLKYLGITKLIPVQELDTGVVRMVIDGFPDFCLTTKPGSYSWPENIWIPMDKKRLNDFND